MSDLAPGDVVTMKSFKWSVDNEYQAELTFARLNGKRKYAFLFLGAGSPEKPLDANHALNALGWCFDEKRAARQLKERRAASGMSASGQDAEERLEAKPASPTAESGDAQ